MQEVGEEDPDADCMRESDAIHRRRSEAAIMCGGEKQNAIKAGGQKGKAEKIKFKEGVWPYWRLWWWWWRWRLWSGVRWVVGFDLVLILMLKATQAQRSNLSSS